ncbi:LytTR family transcriptional regulator [Lysinibacillus xylanilyticus]|uniref:LytTR family DNA-binding domain-containing protein n=1 Tax=Lysinibacillus xylanilyticus TaxID=582475 RepID=UPI002B251F18|nr:LytTR family DNA-binding domain-containing protein [Lysinibacillus xylanilyticus]MEB2278392.1 LytTR family transcriptional regulator [Lysinibacillus xylanilyticus]
MKIDSEYEKPHVTIYTAKLTPTIQAAISLLQKEKEEQILTGLANNKTYIIDPNSIIVIRTEGRELALYNEDNNRLILNKPLYELEKQLGDNFIRISKSAIINLTKVKNIEASFNGTMEIELVLGIKEVITRNYRKQFKKRLGV